MCRRLIHLVSLALMLSLANDAVAALVAHYPLDEGSGTTAGDASGNGHDGTIIGADVEWVASIGGYGWALDFPGTWGQYCDTGTWNPSAATGQITVAFWMSWAGDNSGHQGVVAKRDTWAEPDTMWCLEIDMGSLVMNWHRFGSWVDVGISPPVGEWQHVAVTFDGSTARSYTDGDLHKTAGGFTFGPATGAHVVFGAVEQDNNPFNGTLDEVRIYDRALSAAEIKSLAARYSASNPDPADAALLAQTAVALTWTGGAYAASHHVYFGTSLDDVYNGTGGTDKGPSAWPAYWAPDLEVGKTYYWRIDEVSPTHPDSPWKGPVWSFTIPPKTAWMPNPPDGSKFIDPDVTLSWSEGMDARMHHVYFGDDLDSVDNADTTDTTGIYKGPQSLTFYPGPLALEKVYYWRVDEFDGFGIIHKGAVWSFTTTVPGLGTILREVWEDIGGGNAVADLTSNPRYPDDPSWSDELTLFDFWDLGLDSYGSRLRGWLYIPVAGDYTFWIASDNGSELWLSTDDDPSNMGTAPIAQVPGTDWTGHYEWDKFPEQQSAPITLESSRYYIEALMKEGDGGDGVAVAWQGPSIPTPQIIEGIYLKRYEALWAFGPRPANGATGVTETPTLSWKPGEKAVQHDIYLGTDQAAVANADTAVLGIYRGRQDPNTYIPTNAPLEWDRTYYWRIDEVNTLDPEGLWKGSVWSFTVADHLIVDDFESYGDGIDPGPPPPPGNRIWYTWKDGVGWVTPSPGWNGNGTGSTVDLATSPVHGDLQSMPLNYINNGSTDKALYSEIERTFEPPQNWIAGRVTSLTLWFYGDPDNDAGVTEQMYVKVNGAKVPYPGDMSDITKESWQPCDIPLKDFADAGADLTNVTTLAIGFGDEANTTPGGSGTVYFDDIWLYGPRCLLSERSADFAKADYAPVGNPAGDCTIDYGELEIMASDWLAQDDIIATTAPSVAGLVAYYPLDEGTGTTAADASGNGHDGTLAGNATWVTPGLMGNAAVYIDATPGGKVDIGTWDPSAGTGKLTLSVWAKWAGLHEQSGHQGLIGKRDAWDATGAMRWFFEINTDADNALAFRQFGEAGVDVFSAGGTMDPHIGRWAHTAVTFDGTTARVYLNGKEIASGPFAFADKADASMAIGNTHGSAGWDGSTEVFSGDLDEARIYNRALSSAEITYLADTTPGDGELHVPVPSPAELYEGEAQGSRAVNFRDFAVLAEVWLDEQFWP